MSSRSCAPHYRLTSPSPHSLPCQAWATSNSPLPTQSQPVITRHSATVGWAGTDTSDPLRGKDFAIVCFCISVCLECVMWFALVLSVKLLSPELFICLVESLVLGCISEKWCVQQKIHNSEHSMIVSLICLSKDVHRLTDVLLYAVTY